MIQQHHEEYEQIAIMEWSKLQQGVYPELRLLFHIPNGGYRNAREAALLKLSGVKSGVPDLFLPVARGSWHGLWIELKAGKNKATENQKKWIADLTEQGYLAKVCVGADEAIETIKTYLKEDQK